MRRFFGTDGIRGKVNVFPLTAEFSLKLGQAVASVFSRDGRLRVIIGKDTRLSGYMFESALTAGLTSAGADVLLVGPMPTPAIAHLTKSFACDLGIVISASHNPASDNGIKFFDSFGFKLPDHIEEQIEASLDSPVLAQSVGKAFRIDDAAGRYIEFTKNSVKNMSLSGIKLVLDCANGAAYKVAPLIFTELGADVIVVNNRPDGSNINRSCGALFPEALAQEVLDHQADIGIALDGDADRLIVVDEKGQVVNGDHLMAMCAVDMKSRGKLSSVVVTVMSNLGFHKCMAKHDIEVITTDVGDRYVVDAMKQGGHVLGGEQSGHIIFASRSSTGDGTLAALQVLALMKKSKKPISQLSQVMTSYPQSLVNVKVSSKPDLSSIPAVKKSIEDAEKTLGSDGRVLVRYSGTSDKCRVMVEAKTQELSDSIADSISHVIKREVG